MIFASGTKLREQVKGGLLPVYLLHGEDGPQIEACAKWLKTQALDAFPDMNFSSFDGRASLDLDALADAALSLPFMAERRCVLLDDLNPESLGATQADKLWQLLEGLSPETTLIITARTQPLDLKKKGGRGAKLLALCDKAGGVCAFPKLTRAGGSQFAAQRAKRLGCILDPQAAALLADLCGLDSQRIASETDKLCAYTGTGGTVTRETVELLVTPTADARVFDLSDKIVRGDLTGALHTVDDLLFQREAPVTVLSILSMAFVDMYRAAVAKRVGVPDAEAKKAYGYGGGGFRYTKGMENQRRFTVEQLEDALRLLAQADSSMKSTGGDPRIALETVVVQVFRRLRPA